MNATPPRTAIRMQPGKLDLNQAPSTCFQAKEKTGQVIFITCPVVLQSLKPETGMFK